MMGANNNLQWQIGSQSLGYQPHGPTGTSPVSPHYLGANTTNTTNTTLNNSGHHVANTATTWPDKTVCL